MIKMVCKETWKFEILNEEKPILHINWDGDCFSVYINEAKYANTLPNEKKIDKFDLFHLQEELKTKPKDKDYGGVSYWEYARRTWNINNPYKKIPKMKMPDYRNME